jgi:hypothetical protein
MRMKEIIILFVLYLVIMSRTFTDHITGKIDGAVVNGMYTTKGIIANGLFLCGGFAMAEIFGDFI